MSDVGWWLFGIATVLVVLVSLGGAVWAIVRQVRGHVSHPTPEAPGSAAATWPPHRPGPAGGSGPAPPATLYAALGRVGEQHPEWIVLPGGPEHAVDLAVHWTTDDGFRRGATTYRYAVLVVLDAATVTVHALRKLRTSGSGEVGWSSGPVSSRAATWTRERDEHGRKRWVRTWSFSTSAPTDALAAVAAAHGWGFRTVTRLPRRNLPPAGT